METHHGRPVRRFLSYAHRDQPWVKVLQANLELCLAGKVFLDDVALASGRSWVGQLQAGLGRSGQLILVATPEALASPRVTDEWESFIAGRTGWHDGRLHIVHLVFSPPGAVAVPVAGRPRRGDPERRPCCPVSRTDPNGLGERYKLPRS